MRIDRALNDYALTRCLRPIVIESGWNTIRQHSKATFAVSGKARQFRFDLHSHLAECDLNYTRLCRLMMDMESGELHGVSMLLHREGDPIHFSVTSDCRYTTTINIAQRMPSGIRDLMLVVRVYHDVQSAEVIRFQGQGRFAARYDYPNAQMRTPDEKSQVNRFLGELLTLCLAKGQTTCTTSATKKLDFAN